MSAPALYGLVLSGGRSRRMRRDKAGLVYGGQRQLARALELLAPRVERCFVSIREDQLHEPDRAAHETITDLRPGLGPIGGIHAALHTHPARGWLILACDLPFLDAATLDHLVACRASERVATAYRSDFDGLPEPLCAIFEPAGRAPIARWIEQGQLCPRSFLAQADVQLLELINPRALDNINTPEEYALAQAEVAKSSPLAASTCSAERPQRSLRLQVRYFAVLREQAGRSNEELETPAQTPLELYEELRRRHGLALAPELLRVAINDEFGDWRTRLAEGDTVAFLPPVAGG